MNRPHAASPKLIATTRTLALTSALLLSGLAAIAASAEANVCHLGADGTSRCIPGLGEETIEDKRVGRFLIGEDRLCFVSAISLGCVAYD